jgi:hypothetical protein
MYSKDILYKILPTVKKIRKAIKIIDRRFQKHDFVGKIEHFKSLFE